MSSPNKGSSSVISLLLQINITKKKMGGNENVACYASSFPVFTQQLSATAVTDKTRAFSQGKRCCKMQPWAALPALTLASLVKRPTVLKPAALHTVLLPRRNSPPPVSPHQRHQPATFRCKTGVKAPQPLTRCWCPRQQPQLQNAMERPGTLPLSCDSKQCLTSVH